MSFDPVPSANNASPSVKGLVRRANGEVWVALDTGLVYRALPGSNQFNAVRGFDVTTMSGDDIVGLGATSDELFVLRKTKIHGCRTPCTQFSDFSLVSAPVLGLSVRVGMCSSATTAFFVTNSGSTTGLYELTHTGQTPAFVERTANLGTGYGFNCFIAPSGNVYVAGDQGVAVWLFNGGSVVEPYAYTSSSMPASWRAVGGAGTGTGFTAFVVGGGYGSRFAQRDGGTWNEVPRNPSGELMTTVAALSTTEVLVGSWPNTSSTTPPSLLKWNGTAFVSLSPAPPAMNVDQALVVGPNEVYFGGLGRVGASYVVLHGTR